MAFWGLAQRAPEAARKEQLERMALRSLVVMMLVMMLVTTGFLVVGFVSTGIRFGPLAVTIGLGVPAAISLFLGAAGIWVWLQWSEQFELSEDSLLPTSYGKVRHRMSRIPLRDIRNPELYVGKQPAEPGMPPRFHWYFETPLFGTCDIDGDVLEEAKIPASARAAVLARIEAFNVALGGKRKELPPLNEEAETGV